MTIPRTIKLDPKLDRAVDALAASRNVPRSEIVREALAVYVKRAGGQESFASAAVDLVGCVVGPRDLSTGRAHLQGYGE